MLSGDTADQVNEQAFDRDLVPPMGDPRPEPEVSVDLPGPADGNDDARAEAGAAGRYLGHAHTIEERWHQPVQAEWHDADGRPCSLFRLALSIHYAPRVRTAFFKLALRADTGIAVQIMAPL